MRLSLWQAFSSNHSASFTIVGIYPTLDAAKNASEVVDSVLKSIEAWHVKHREEAEALWVNRQISSFEQAIGKKYHLEWNQAVLWNGYIIALYDQILVVSNQGQSDTGAAPIHKLMEILGGDVLVNGDFLGMDDFGGQIAIEMEWDAPSAAIAVEIAAANGGKSNGKRVTIGLDSDDSPQIDLDLNRILTTLKKHGCTLHAIWSSQSRRHWLK